MAAPPGLLNTKSPLLPFNVNGTTDLILVEQASIAAKLEASGIRAVIELKKDLVVSRRWWSSSLRTSPHTSCRRSCSAT